MHSTPLVEGPLVRQVPHVLPVATHHPHPKWRMQPTKDLGRARVRGILSQPKLRAKEIAVDHVVSSKDDDLWLLLLED